MNFIITRNILSSRLTGFDFFFFCGWKISSIYRDYVVKSHLKSVKIKTFPPVYIKIHSLKLKLVGRNQRFIAKGNAPFSITEGRILPSFPKAGSWNIDINKGRGRLNFSTWSGGISEISSVTKGKGKTKKEKKKETKQNPPHSRETNEVKGREARAWKEKPVEKGEERSRKPWRGSARASWYDALREKESETGSR